MREHDRVVVDTGQKIHANHPLALFMSTVNRFTQALSGGASASA
jgi:hypothetical protein